MKSRKAKTRVAAMGVVCACGLLVYALIARGGGLEPTAPPGPTMHTLDEIYKVCSSSTSPFNVLVGGNQGGMFIRFHGVDGEATDPYYSGWCDLLSFGQGHSLPDTGPGGTKPKVVFEPIGLLKGLDKASPKLAEAVCTKNVFSDVEIHATFTTGAGGREIYCTYELKNVLIVSYLILSGGPPKEQLALEFEEIKFTYFQYDSTGHLLGRFEYTHTIN